MKMIHQAEDRRLYVQMGSAAVAALAAVLLLCLAAVSIANRATRDAYAGIIATVSQKYPLAEAAVVQELRLDSDSSTEQGYQILSRYGLDHQGGAATRISAALLSRLLPGGLAFTIALCAAFTALLLRYQRSMAVQIESLSGYLRRLEAGDYSLDIRDNGEGSLSLLKNDLYKITVRLREQADRLQQEKVRLSDAIADISHQIKTPLTSLFVLTDLLAGEPPQETRQEFIERLRAQLGRIQWLVSALLKLARLDAGTAQLKREPVNLRRLVEMAVEPLKIPIEIKKQRLEIRGDERAGFEGDFNWSVEALANVIKNCVEHTPEGGKIAVAFGENSLYSEIRIADDGAGIAREDLPNIFNRFFRGQNAAENSVGIGLALAKAIFLAQGGDICVWSEAGQGTRFEVKVFRSVD